MQYEWKISRRKWQAFRLLLECPACGAFVGSLWLSLSGSLWLCCHSHLIFFIFVVGLKCRILCIIYSTGNGREQNQDLFVVFFYVLFVC